MFKGEALRARVVLVTGGSRGIGAAAVTALREAGARVAYTWLNNPGQGSDLALRADVRDKEAMVAAVAQIERELGPIDAVVANAGITGDALFPKLTHESWQEVIDTNLTGVYNTLHPIVPRMCERRRGAVVVVSSVVGERGNLGQVNYAASKAAVIGLTKALARETARHGVRVNAVAPGFIETDMLKTVPERVRERLQSEIPLQRFGQPTDVAAAILFLLSEDASPFITGEVLRVNGGYHM